MVFFFNKKTINSLIKINYFLNYKLNKENHKRMEFPSYFNTFIVSSVYDLYLLRLSLYKYVNVVYYDIIRPFEKNDFPQNISVVHLKYSMIEQNFSCLPKNVKEICFHHNVENLDLNLIPKTVSTLSFYIPIGQSVVDNLPTWLKHLKIFFFSRTFLSYDNLPVGLESIYFEKKEIKTDITGKKSIDLSYIPPNCVIFINDRIYSN